MSYTLQNPFISFVDANKPKPVGLGKLFVGLPDTDPEQFPVDVYAVQPDGTELLLSQPITLTSGGVASFNGSPVQLKIDAESVSIKVTTQAGAQVYYSAQWTPPEYFAIETTVKKIGSIKDLIAESGKANEQYQVLSYHDGWAASNTAPRGGGVFTWQPDKPKYAHNGGTVIDPSAPYPVNWNDQSQLSLWFSSANAGNGCFVKEITGKINVAEFGTKGEYNPATKNGVNDAKAWQKCIDVATALGIEATSAGVKESFISESIFITCAFDGSCTTLYCKGGPSGIGSGKYAVYIQANKTVGTGALLQNTKILVPQLWNVDKPALGWSGQCHGLQVNNVDSSHIDVKRGIVFFNNGMYVTSHTPDGAGTAYNDFYLGRLVYNNVNLLLQPVGTGYVNENNFYSGKLGDLTTDRSNTYLALLPPTGQGFGGPNANKFYGLTVEDGGSGTLATHILLGGPFNIFIGTRFEFIGALGKIVFWRENGNDPTDNLFVGGYSYGDYEVTATSGVPSSTNKFKDVGRSPDIDGRFVPIYSSVPPGGSTPYHRLYESGRDLFTASVADTDWVYQLTNGGGLQTKDAASTNAQVQIAGGRAYFGTGSSDINASPYLENVNGGIGSPSHNFTTGNGAWNGSHLIMGMYHFWVDSTGALRIKSGDPTSDTDGVVVGSQT